MPTLILHGKRDRLAPFELAEAMHAGIPGSKMITLRGRHLVFFFRPHECIEAIDEFPKAV